MIVLTTLQDVALCRNAYRCIVTSASAVSSTSNIIFTKSSKPTVAVEVIAGHLVCPSADRSREWALFCRWREPHIDRNSGLWFHSSSRLFALHSTGYYVHTYQPEILDT